ncbi:TetR/AcrR family transcriptional regulator [Virgibacillus sp. 179-BFC.A HS]|uniref:TetR/AcrR family transcriptional regulator n=1 Tax=Tigheibacillus jepli TaxID=3035914 RepID=A0ABU5CDA5_9BACI|nr:TetR/AcrR family transcriptional regulator [Virgibacillus sp. 179-BFC.A HS]MDY0404308.1 TetR/AcrR family transcriptional regulator [Virgibacillus sp. 179-BFC.A HS]
MNGNKRQEIIETAIKLSAENGFGNTSVQDIVNHCGISKGAFYNYFSSKEELHIAIFQYHFKKMHNILVNKDNSNLPPREILRKQLWVSCEHFRKYREFFIIYFREQTFSINKELHEVMEKAQYEMFAFYEKNLRKIYGETIHRCIGDVIVMMEGIRNSYLAMMLIYNLDLDSNSIVDFLMHRLDDIVHGFENGEEPVINVDNLQLLVSKSPFSAINKVKQAKALLTDMAEQLNMIAINAEDKRGLQEVIQFLQDELEKPELNKYAFQGMLANLKTIKGFDIYRKKIAKLLDIQLL